MKILNEIEKSPEFDDHKFVSFLYDRESGLRGFIAIHRGNTKHPAFGATRFWNYESEFEALRDVLKLSKAMSYKAALSGLKYGGAKGVIMRSPIIEKNKKLAFKIYAERVNYLSGHFITGADVGISKQDVKEMHRVSPYMVGVKADPVKFTTLGIYYSIRVCLEQRFGSEKIEGRTFAIQGLGKIGSDILEMLYERGGKIYAADINQAIVRKIKIRFPDINIVKPSQIHKQEVDVFSPCALGNCINHSNIKELRCKIIAGGANNQLEDVRVGKKLHKSGILYAPDYVVNAGGLISVVDEFEYKDYRVKRVKERVAKIGKSLRKIIRKSERENRATNLVADEMAEEVFNALD